MAKLQAADEMKSTEIAKLKASLEVYKDDTGAPSDIAQKADISALRAEVESQREVIETLRAEVAASQERLSRQALHFHEELRRRGTEPEDESSTDNVAKPSLAERIAAPRSLWMA